MPLPNNNLPSSSQQWAREVEKQLDAINNTVRVNEINNFARDTTSEASISNLSKLIADQAELTTYSTELEAPQTVNFTTFSSSFTKDTSSLDIYITLSKPRRLLINYSTYYSAQLTIAATGDTSAFSFGTTLFVNGSQVDYLNTQKYQFVNTPNNLIQDFGSINVSKLVPVPAGSHKISVQMQYGGSPTTGGSLLMSTSGDNLIVTVVQ